MEFISDFIYNLLETVGVYGPILSCLLIVFESIIPIMPLAVFITINFMAYGSVIGFILSWVFTILGCLMSFFLFRKGVQGWFQRLIKNKDKLNNLMIKFNNISFSELTVLIAMPFTPAFLVNIAAGLSKMDFKKYFFAILIGKIALVYFWGYIGTSLIESFRNPMILLKIAIILALAYVISRILKKLLKL